MRITYIVLLFIIYTTRVVLGVIMCRWIRPMERIGILAQCVGTNWPLSSFNSC